VQQRCVYSSNGSKLMQALFCVTTSAVLLGTAVAWAQSGPAPAAGHSDTVLNATGSVSGQPAPDVSPVPGNDSGARAAVAKPAAAAPRPGPVPDTTLSPMGGYASSPPPQTGPYDAPDFAPVAELNKQLPKWIQFGLEERFRFESPLGIGFRPGNDDAYFLNRLRFGASIQATSWLRVVGQFQDARPMFLKPPVGPPNQVRWDLKQAYVELGGSEGSPVSLRVGRQIIDYNSTIFGNSEWRNQGRSYDAAVMNIHVDRYRLGIFAASIVNPTDLGISHHLDGNNVYGLYGGIEKVIPNSVIEPFVLWRVTPSVSVETPAGSRTGKLSEQAGGVRLRGKQIHQFDYRAEAIVERGSAGSNDIRAWATTFGAGYTFASLRGEPRIFAGYDFASGDKNPTDGVRNTFDVMYPNGHDRFGITDQFGWQNIISYRAGVTVRLRRRLFVTGQYLNFSLANAKDGAYDISGRLIARDRTGRSGRHLGESYEGYLWYELNRRVPFGAGIGHIFPGEFLAKATRGSGYTYPYVVVNFLDGKRLLVVP
jgi:Alginate export